MGGKIYEEVNKKKIGKELKFIELEKAFGHFRLSRDKNGIKNLWENVLTSLGAFENRQSIPQGPSNEPHLILLQHVLQHVGQFWPKKFPFTRLLFQQMVLPIQLKVRMPQEVCLITV